VGVISDVEKERLGEALNAGIARALSDGVPGLSYDTVIGSVAGDDTLTSADTTLGSSSCVTVGAATDGLTHPRDILVLDVSGTKTKFLIRKQTAAEAFDIGPPASTSISGGTASKIIRRGIELPSTGQVIEVRRMDSSSLGKALEFSPARASIDPFETGTPKYFEQRYDPYNASSYVALCPAPTAATDQFLIRQSTFLTELDDDTDTLDFPEEAIDAILERARMAYLTWTGTSVESMVGLGMHALRDTEDSLKNSSAGRQVYTKA